MTIDTNKKIFFIGLHKTATSSLHFLCLHSGYSSIHNICTQTKARLLKVIHKNIKESSCVLKNLEQYRCFSDFTYYDFKEALELPPFKELYKEYPDSYYVLNTRETQGWIKSKLNHPNLAKRGLSAFKLHSIEDLIDLWVKQREKYQEEVKEFFKDKNANFMIFDIKKDNIEDLISFVKSDFILEKRFWKNHNRQ